MIGGEGGGAKGPLARPREERASFALIGGGGGSTREPSASPQGERARLTLISKEGGTTREPPARPQEAQGREPEGEGAVGHGTQERGRLKGGGRRGVMVARMQPTADGEPGGLCAGSADPHCLWAPGVVAEPADRQPAAFGMGMMEEASTAELARREFPMFNAAPRTAWRNPPEAPMGPPPEVSKLTDVVPRKVLREVFVWTRRMEASLRAAERGNVRMAKSLRPADLCLEEGHMVAGTEQWVWDLRPLQMGQRAEPLWPSGDGRLLETDLSLEAVRAAGVGFADQGIVSELLHGVSDDGPEGGATVLSPPHEGALMHYAEVMKRVVKDVGRGWASEGWRLPFWPIRANAYSIVVETRAAKTNEAPNGD